MSARRASWRLWLVAFLAIVLGGSVTGGVVLAAGPTAARAPSDPPSRPAAPPGPLRVLSTTPAAGATGVAPASDVVVQLSAPVRLRADPVLSPSVPGRWSQPSPSILLFHPSQPYTPDTSVTLSIPTTLTAVSGAGLAVPETVRWTVANGSTLRLQQVLASLGYLPLDFQPSAPVPGTLAAQINAAVDPPPGTFSWRWPNPPVSLQALWQEGVYNVMTRGAVMAFEADHGLAVDGVAGPEVWSALVQAAADGGPPAAGYSYVQVSETLPEQLVLWHDGTVAVSSLANTGVPGAATPTGTWPIYARYTSTTMIGTDPNGTHYDDPGVPFVNYFYLGDAVHGFPRAQYGYPQSNGCVELPIGAARTAYGLLHLGSLVTVTA